MQSFLHSCQEVKGQLQAHMSCLDPADVSRSSFSLPAEDQTQVQALKDIQALEARISYLRSVANM